MVLMLFIYLKGENVNVYGKVMCFLSGYISGCID